MRDRSVQRTGDDSVLFGVITVEFIEEGKESEVSTILRI